MDGALRKNSLLVSDSGNRYKVVRMLGAGGQGEVYEVECGTKRAALKWYFPKMNNLTQKRILENLITKGAPDDSFLWPEDMLSQNTGGSLGYVMKLRPAEYKSIVDMMKRKAEPSFSVLCKAAFYLTRGYQKLHSLGYCYRDISYGNVFFDPDTGNILICDNDNVSASGYDDSSILGTPRFMAPEIVVGTAKPSRNTDLYSLSVLLFIMFMLHHPLEGKREADIRCMDIFAMTQLFGKNPLFIFDPDDDSNRPVKGYQGYPIVYWNLYPQLLKDLFTTAFTVGLSHPNRRVTENQWLDTLSNLLSQIMKCSQCGAEVFYGVNSCWACGLNIPEPLIMTIGKRKIALTFEASLYSHNINGDYDINTVVGRVVRNPSNPDLLGIRNETANAWMYIKADGTQLPIAPSKSAAITSGVKLDFGESIGEV